MMPMAAHPLKNSLRLNKAIADGAQIAIGSRAKPDPSCNVKALPYRTYIGNTFNYMFNLYYYRAYMTRNVALNYLEEMLHAIFFSASLVTGYAFDVESYTLLDEENIA